MGSHGDKLTLLPITYYIGFQVPCPVVVTVPFDDTLGLFHTLEVVIRKNSGAGVVGPRTDDLSRFNKVLISKHIIGGCLNI